MARRWTAADIPSQTGRVVVVHNGVPGPAASTPPRRVLKQPVRLVQIGRITPRKGTVAVLSGTEVFSVG